MDEETLALVEKLLDSSTAFRSRSAVIRTAVRDYAEREARRRADEQEREVLRNNKDVLDRQLRALVKAQAKE